LKFVILYLESFFSKRVAVGAVGRILQKDTKNSEEN
jgi:hypothetical protein